MTRAGSWRRLALWLLTTAVSVPLGWWAARLIARTGSDLVWATLTCGPPWVVLRLIAGDFRWNAFFFGFLPPVLAFEVPTGLGTDLRKAALLVVLAPLVAYAIFGLTNLIMYGGAGAARVAREAIGLDEDVGTLRRRFGHWLCSSIASGVRWYVVWLGGASIGFFLALTTGALARAAGASSSAVPLAMLARSAVGLVAGGLAWALLRSPLSSQRPAKG